MNPLDDSIDPRVKAALDQLRPASPRDPQAEARGRAAFLAQAQMLGQAVSARPIRRHRGQIHFFLGKELSPMTTIATIVLVLALALGGTGGAVYAAQNDLPTETLYSLKLLSEDARLSLTADPTARANLLLEFAQRRVQEITALSAKSQPPLEPVATRLREEVDAALQMAASVDDATRNRMLAQIQAQLETELQAMTQAEAIASGEAAPILDQTRTMLQERQQLCQIGLADPQAFRDQLGDLTRDQDQDRLRDQTGTPQAGDQDQDRLREQTGTPQRGPDPSRTPEPIGTALGPGPVNTPPGAGPQETAIGPGPQETAMGPGPQETAMGPGPQETAMGPGPQETAMGPGPQETAMGPGPQETAMGPGPQETAMGPGPQETAMGPGPMNTPVGSGGPKKP